MNYVILFFIYAILGWCMEVLLILLRSHKLVNRGFLIGPYCPIYGYGGLLMTIILTKYNNDIIIVFSMSFLIGSLLEYVTSYILEKIFHARWWDYSYKKMHLNGRISLGTSCGFGILGVIIVCFLNPAILALVYKIPYNILIIILVILGLLYVIDNIVSFSVMFGLRKTFLEELNRSNHKIFTIKKDNTEDITKRVKQIILSKSYLYKRFNDVFPRLQLIRLKKK